MLAPASVPDGDRVRFDLRIRGLVQGVGFRPFVCRLASELGLGGRVANRASGVRAEIEGASASVARFLERLPVEIPRGARIDSIAAEPASPRGEGAFEIEASRAEGSPGPLPLDAAPCAECVAELFRPGDRRHRHPFVSCAVCGPRYTIVASLPYDRERTSMHRFEMCTACATEYRDPWDRRFHAQANCCPSCGPRLSLLDRHGRLQAESGDALERTVAALRAGAIVAVKGVGGHQLVVDAGNATAVVRLREAKHRPHKPFAVLVGSLREARRLCRVRPAEASVLSSPRAPIVLLERRAGASGSIADAVAPGNPDLGVMLPPSGLHHLLAADAARPLVVTSANRPGDPIEHRDEEAVASLRGLADLYLVHDRPILHPIDDSVVRVVHGAPRVLRSARGYAPMSIAVDGLRARVVAHGAHLKNTIAVSACDSVRLSPHIGDLRSPAARALSEGTARWFAELESGVSDTSTAVDLHPDDARTDPREVQVQHHHAHVLACMAEHRITDAVLGVVWDGNGHGPDGTVWGGEFLVCDRREFRRVAHLRTFPLPGAERAMVEGRRSALGLLYEIEGSSALHDPELAPVRSFRVSERRTIDRMLARGINSPRTSSMGRLFDGVASLMGLRQKVTFEGQAALALEHAARGPTRYAPYPFPLTAGEVGEPMVADWAPLLAAVRRDLRIGLSTAWIAGCFHEALAELVVAVAREVGIERVALSGGCFQNQRLLERSIDRLREAGFAPLCHQHVPPNDGGIALGQVVHAATRHRRGG